MGFSYLKRYNEFVSRELASFTKSNHRALPTVKKVNCKSLITLAVLIIILNLLLKCYIEITVIFLNSQDNYF